MRSPCAASDFVEQGVIFDIGAFCAALAAKGPEDLEAVAECTLVGLDTDAEPTHELGLVLPALERLRLRQSTVRSFRDFGCDLGRPGHPRGAVLDLESNRVAAAAEVATLGTCEKLSCLTLLGNPVVGALEASGGYAGGVLARVPHLEVLDDAPVGSRRDAAAPVDVVDLAGPADEAALDDFIRQESAVVSEAIKVFRPRTADAAAESRAGPRRRRRPDERAPAGGCATWGAAAGGAAASADGAAGRPPLARGDGVAGGDAAAEARAMAHSLSSPALGSPSRGAAVAPAPSHVPITSVQKQALARKAPQRKKKLQGVSISHMDLARRAAGRADLNRKVRGALPPTP
ncbi:hypothetical protein JL720_15352 [Aureococcus anophagefferens]|nr:hypothetical protein JL720_15352 [Aureococcus anophagefferens]